MAHFRAQVIGVITAVCSSTSTLAATVEDCRQIADPGARLACYDSSPALKNEPAQPIDQTSRNVAPFAKPTPTPAPKTTNDAPKQKPQAKAVSGALKTPLPRRAATASATEQKAVQYTITRVSRKRDEKIEYQTADGRRFRKLSANQSSFAVGDRVVATLGVFNAVFLINQDGIRIKVKPLN
jgi:type IV secretory pathway VirB10-like protein